MKREPTESKDEAATVITLGRRTFIKNGALILTTATMDVSSVFADEKEPSLKVGLVTDLHYADKPPAGMPAVMEDGNAVAVLVILERLENVVLLAT